MSLKPKHFSWVLFITLYFKKIFMRSDLISPHFETSERRNSKISPKTFEGGDAPSDLPSWFDELFFVSGFPPLQRFKSGMQIFACIGSWRVVPEVNQPSGSTYLGGHSTEVALALLTQLPVVQFWAFLKHFSTKIYWGTLLSQWTVSIKQTHLAQSRGPQIQLGRTPS